MHHSHVFFTNTKENVSPSTTDGYCELQEVTQKSLAQGRAETAHVSWTTSKASAPRACSKCLAKVPSVPPPCEPPPAKPSLPWHLPSPRYLVRKQLLQSLSTQPSCLKLLASLISCLPFHQGLGLSKEVGQKDLAGRNKHKLTICIAGMGA